MIKTTNTDRTSISSVKFINNQYSITLITSLANRNGIELKAY